MSSEIARFLLLGIGAFLVLLQSEDAHVRAYAYVDGGRDHEPVGLLETLLARVQQSAQSVWERVRGETTGRVQGLVKDLERQELDALDAASQELGKFGINVDLNTAGDTVNQDLFSCARATRARYDALLSDLRARVESCWGWEAREARSTYRHLVDVLHAGDRLPALIRENMDRCMRASAPQSARRRTRDASDQDEGAGKLDEGAGASPSSPSALRVFRCTAESANLTWAYVRSVPVELVRVARRTAGLLGSSRDDWLACARRTVREESAEAVRVAKDLGSCVTTRISTQTKRQLEQAWDTLGLQAETAAASATTRPNAWARATSRSRPPWGKA